MTNKSKFDVVMSSIIIALLATVFVLFLIGLSGCTHTKKAVTHTDSTATTGSQKEYVTLTNTIYTDTGTTTTYYRDTAIVINDTVFQPIEKIVNKYYKQLLKHDSIYIHIHDTTTVILEKKVVEKDKKSMGFFIQLATGFGILILIIGIGFLVYSKFKK